MLSISSFPDNLSLLLSPYRNDPERDHIICPTDNCPCLVLMSKFCSVIHVTSFSRISGSNSEYWTRKPIQSGNIHSIILNVYDG